MMRLRDTAFQFAFSHLFVYNILWEDSEVDETFLGVNEGSRVLGISGAGCGLAGLLSRRPEQVDAVDINGHHLALSALKMAGAQFSDSYSTFYDLFARGWAANPREVVGRLAAHLPREFTTYWKHNYSRFSRSALHEGMTAKLILELRRRIGIDASWLRALIPLEPEERTRRVEEWFRPVFERKEVRLLLNSPLQLVSLGINFEQRDRIVETEGQTMGDYLLAHLKRVAATDLRTNWFAWYSVAGHYDHDNQEAVPPYLRRDRWEKSAGAPTKVNFHRKNIFDVLAASEPSSYSHYTLCDMPDWLPEAAQKRLLKEIFRTSRDGAILLYRTVEDDCMVERHQEGHRFEALEEATRLGSALERSRQYRHTRFYRVTH